MTTTKNKKMAAGVGIAAVAVAALALGAGTFAAFQDTETGPSGTLAAGTLDLTAGADPAAAYNFTATNIAPGYASTPYTVTLTNAGTIPGDLSFTFVPTGTENGCSEPETVVDTSCTSGNGELDDKLIVSIDGPGALDYTGPVSGIPGGALPAGSLAANGGTATFVISYSLPKATTGNEVQSDGVAITTNAVLNQQ